MLALVDDAALARLVIAAGVTPLHVYRLDELSDRAVEGMPARPRTVSGRLISLRHRPSTAATTPCPPRRRHHGQQPDRRRALELLAASRDGATEAVMLAHGFTVAQIVELAVAWDSPRQ